MDQFIKSFWNQIVGPIDNGEKVDVKGEEEEEKKAPSIYDSDKPKESSIYKVISTKQFHFQTFLNIQLMR